MLMWQNVGRAHLLFPNCRHATAMPVRPSAQQMALLNQITTPTPDGPSPATPSGNTPTDRPSPHHQLATSN